MIGANRYLRRLTASGALVILATAALSSAWAQAFPTKPVTLIVGFSPGGSNDIVARAIAQPLSEDLGVPVVVENKLGAAGMIGAKHVAEANPDGYTLMVGGAGPLALTAHTHPKVPYDARKDFAAISLIGITPETLAINPKISAKNLQELVTLAKQQPLTLASAGAGTLPHLAIELLKLASGANILHVPYKGATPAVTDTLAGHVDGVVLDLPAVYNQIKDGRLRGIAMANENRSEFLPDLPTSGEQGLASFVAVNWIGLVAPKGTPKPIIDRLHKALLHAMQKPTVKEQLAQAAVEISTNETPAEFQAFILAEYEKWGRIVRESNVAVGS